MTYSLSGRKVSWETVTSTSGRLALGEACEERFGRSWGLQAEEPVRACEAEAGEAVTDTQLSKAGLPTSSRRGRQAGRHQRTALLGRQLFMGHQTVRTSAE